MVIWYSGIISPSSAYNICQRYSLEAQASVAQFDAHPTGYQEVGFLTPARSATFFCEMFSLVTLWFEKFARIFSRRHKQTTFSDAGFLGVLRANIKKVLCFI